MISVTLADKFGATYDRYRQSVLRWIPCLKPYRENDSGSRKTNDIGDVQFLSKHAKTFKISASRGWFGMIKSIKQRH